MTQRILHLNVCQIFRLFPAERSAGRREKNLRNAVPVFSLQRLENSAVLAVDRQNRHAAFFCQRHNNMACRHKRLLVRKCNLFPRFNGCNRRSYAEHPDNRRHKDLALRLYRHLQKSIHAGHHADIQILRAIAQFFGGVLLKNAYQQRMKLSHLLFQLFDVASGRNRRHLYVALLPHNI